MRYSLKHIAFELFRKWYDDAKDAFPDLIKPIADESVLVKDLTTVMFKAKDYLVTKEDARLREEEGYDYDFIIGYTWSALNKRWFHQYIAKNSDRYKELTMLKAIWEHLKENSESGQRINDLYEKMLNAELNALHPKHAFASKVSSKHGLQHLLEEQEYSLKGTHVCNYLEQQISQHIIKISDVNPENFLPELEDYISTDMVQLILCPGQN